MSCGNEREGTVEQSVSWQPPLYRNTHALTHPFALDALLLSVLEVLGGVLWVDHVRVAAAYDVGCSGQVREPRQGREQRQHEGGGVLGVVSTTHLLSEEEIHLALPAAAAAVGLSAGARSAYIGCCVCACVCGVVRLRCWW